MNISLPQSGELTLQYGGTDLVTLHGEDLSDGHGSVEVLIDKTVAEIFVDGGRRYIVRELPAGSAAAGLRLHAEAAPATLNRITVYQLKSMWKGQA